MTSKIETSARGSLRRALWALGLGTVLVAVLPGCLAHASGEVVYEYPAEYVEPPPRVEYYPSVYYRGAPAYLVEGRWYYRTRDRWIVFRDEPAELRSYRVRQAPAYLAPHRDNSARQREHLRVDRRAEARRDEERRRHQARDEERHRAEQFRRAEEQRRQERQRRAEEQRRHFDQQRATQHRAAEERREHDRRGHRAERKRDRSDDEERHGHKRNERDRRQFRHD